MHPAPVSVSGSLKLNCQHCGGPRSLYGPGEGCPALGNGTPCVFPRKRKRERYAAGAREGKGGRPALPPEQHRARAITVRFTAAEYAAIEREAQRQHVTETELVRRAVFGFAKLSESPE